MKLHFFKLLAGLALLAGASLTLLISSQNAGSVSKMQYLGSVPWRWPGEERFGGLSGLEINGNGTELIAVSDRPALIYARLERQGNSIVNIQNERIARPRSPDSTLYFDEVNNDTEALALEKNGRLWISTENYHDVEYFLPGEYSAHHIDYPEPNEAFKTLPPNKGLEALSIDPQGRLIAIPESWDGDAFPVFRLDNNRWVVSGTIPKRGAYVPVGADTGPDGFLYLLERRYLLGIGFSSRVRRFAFLDDGVAETDTLLQTRFRTHGNLEGLAVWSDNAGAIMLTMVPDDNFSPFLRTEIVEYRWDGTSG